MSLTASLQHNQSLVIAALISLIAAGSMIGCHLSETQKQQLLETSHGVITAAVTKEPIPWPEIGKLIGVLLGSGLLVDNRRKDVVINQLKKQANDHTKLIANLTTAQR